MATQYPPTLGVPFPAEPRRSPGPAPARTAPARRRRRWQAELAGWWREIDRVLLLLAVTLMAVGAAAVLAASPASARRPTIGAAKLADLHFFYLQLLFLGIGFVALLLTSTFTKERARRSGILLAAAMLVGLILVPFFGGEINGARRWFNFGVSLQPSAFMMPGFSISMAWVMSWKSRDPGLPVIGISFGAFALVAALLMAEPDFGSTMMFCTVWFVMVLLSGLSVKRFAVVGLVGLGGLAATYMFYANARHRIDSFIGGGTAYDQVDLARRTLLDGGWTGTGLWLGVRKLSLPEAHTDYIFSVIGEEFGLLVCGAIVLLYLAVAVRVLMRLAEEEDLFTVLAGAGLATQICAQAFINILVNLQMFPSKGLPLPLISYGGSSTIAMCLSFGLLLAITRRNPFLQRERFDWRAKGTRR
jgi:cell division protein FtsW